MGHYWQTTQDAATPHNIIRTLWKSEGSSQGFSADPSTDNQGQSQMVSMTGGYHALLTISLTKEDLQLGFTKSL